MVESPVRIENRAQLMYVLSEASELEHGLSCCYQFAAFSLRSEAGDGLTEDQLKAVTRWKRTILDTAIDEMFHLAAASNILTAIGGSPHFRRPNFPASPRMYPPGFLITLAPFSEETVRRFVFVERPEAMLLPEGSPEYRHHPLDRPFDIFPGAQVYETVGHLYRAVEDGLSYLADKYGEDGLFVGATSQTTIYGAPPTVDLTSATQAIESIVTQGEGARGDIADAHYGRFNRVLDEFLAIKDDDPNFAPAHPVVANPYSRIPGDVHPSVEVSILDAPMSAALCNLFDGCYDMLVLLFARTFAHNAETDAEHETLAEAARRMMVNVIRPLGELVMTLPAGSSHPGQTAGPSFHILRNAHALPHKEAAWKLFPERLRELWGYSGLLETYEDAPKALAPITASLGELFPLLTANSARSS